MLVLWGLSLASAGSLRAGVLALHQGRPEAALALLRAAAAEEGAPDDALRELGWAHWELRDFDAAAEVWGRVSYEPWRTAAQTRAQLAQIEPAAAAVPVEAAGATLRFVAGGDTMMGSDLHAGDAGLPPGDGTQLFAAVADWLRSADVAFLNLEGPLADDIPSAKCAPRAPSCYAFRTPTRFAPALASVGVDLVSLANNHALDLGSAGQAATMRTLDGLGIAHAGAYGDVGTVEVRGVRVALVAAHSGSCCLSVNRLEELQAAVVLADQTHDLVVVSFHGGAEGSKARHVPGRVEVAWKERRGDVRALARAVVDAGADLVLGHGPHVLRAMEVYRGRLIAYSLGNFLGYQRFGAAGGYGRRTVVLDAQIAANGVLVSARLHPLRLDSSAVPHADASGAGLQDVRELSGSDFPQTGVRVAPDGALAWGDRAIVAGQEDP